MASNRRERSRGGVSSNGSSDASRASLDGSRDYVRPGDPGVPPSPFWAGLLLALGVTAVGVIFWRLGAQITMQALSWGLLVYALVQALRDRYDRVAAVFALLILVRVW